MIFFRTEDKPYRPNLGIPINKNKITPIREEIMNPPELEKEVIVNCFAETNATGSIITRTMSWTGMSLPDGRCAKKLTTYVNAANVTTTSFTPDEAFYLEVLKYAPVRGLLKENRRPEVFMVTGWTVAISGYSIVSGRRKSGIPVDSAIEFASIDVPTEVRMKLEASQERYDHTVIKHTRFLLTYQCRAIRLEDDRVGKRIVPTINLFDGLTGSNEIARVFSRFEIFDGNDGKFAPGRNEQDYSKDAEFENAESGDSTD